MYLERRGGGGAGALWNLEYVRIIWPAPRRKTGSGKREGDGCRGLTKDQVQLRWIRSKSVLVSSTPGTVCSRTGIGIIAMYIVSLISHRAVYIHLEARLEFGIQPVEEHSLKLPEMWMTFDVYPGNN